MHHIDETTLFEIIREMSSFSGRQCDGYVTLRDFRASFTPNSSTLLKRGPSSSSSVIKRPDGIPTPKLVKMELNEIIFRQLYGTTKNGSQIVEIENKIVTEDMLEKFEIRCKTNMSMNEIWNSRGTMSRARVSLWENVYKKRLFGAVGRKHKILLSLGHYGSVGYTSPNDNKTVFKVEFGHYGSKRRRVRGSDILQPAFHKFCKYPVRYHLVWSQHRGGQNLYVWEPVPMDGYIGMGMIATNTDAPPPLNSMQTVPKEWTVKTTMLPKLLWTDEGTGGRPGSLWTINRLGLFAATVGHKPPKGPFYDFKSKTFTVVDDSNSSSDALSKTGSNDSFDNRNNSNNNGEQKANDMSSESRHSRSASSDEKRLKMLNLMRRKSLHQNDVEALKKLMEEEKNNETGDSEVNNPLSLLR
jgi:hypothetical protein